MRQLQSAKIKSIKKIGVRKVVDLTVEHNHTFVTGQNIVVHNCNSFQPALRGFIEQFSKNVRFIITCNYVNKILPPILSRCVVIPFEIRSDEKETMLRQSYARLVEILNNENVGFDPKALAQILARYYPDLRQCINKIQGYSADNGYINTSILVDASHNNFNQLVATLKDKDFKAMRIWVATNKDISSEQIFRFFYTNSHTFMAPESVPQMILTTAEYQYRQAFVSDGEINIAGYLTELMSGCNFV